MKIRRFYRIYNKYPHADKKYRIFTNKYHIYTAYNENLSHILPHYFEKNTACNLASASRLNNELELMFYLVLFLVHRLKKAY